MILWTIQPEKIYKSIIDDGVYRCDFEKSSMKYWKLQYDWLVNQMRIRVGDPPENVTYPVWAWYLWEGRSGKPDLRKERWQNGFKGDQFVSLEIDIPDNMTLLSDFDSWSIILNNGLLSETEQEDEDLEKEYDSLPDDKKWVYKSANWERVFDLTPLDNDWITRGSSIQATFWELKREQIKEVRYFVSAYNRSSIIH